MIFMGYPLLQLPPFFSEGSRFIGKPTLRLTLGTLAILLRHAIFYISRGRRRWGRWRWWWWLLVGHFDSLFLIFASEVEAEAETEMVAEVLVLEVQYPRE